MDFFITYEHIPNCRSGWHCWQSITINDKTTKQWIGCFPTLDDSRRFAKNTKDQCDLIEPENMVALLTDNLNRRACAS